MARTFSSNDFQSADEVSPWKFSLSACVSSALLLPLSIHFWGPLVGVALVPAILVFCLANRACHAAMAAFGTGWVASLLVQYTLWTFSFRGTLILALYQGLTWIPVALGVRILWRRWRVPLTITWPLAWVAGEMLRTLGPMGTPFGMLAVPRTTEIWMLQIADLGGHGMAGLPLAMIQGWVGDVFLEIHKKRSHLRQFRPMRNRRVLATAAIVAATWSLVFGYGQFRINQVEGELTAGPTVAVVSSDFPRLSGPDADYDPGRVLEELKKLSEEAVRETSPKPALVIWPESVIGDAVPSLAFAAAPYDPRMALELVNMSTRGKISPVVPEKVWETIRRDAGTSITEFDQWVTSLGVPVILGAQCWVPAPPAKPTPFQQYNVALTVAPGVGQFPIFQPKVRLYPLGEQLPGKDTVLEPLLESILGLPRHDYAPGDRRYVYTLDPHGLDYVVSICSELTFCTLPGDLLRPGGEKVEGKPYDFMINIANEGVFRRNATLDLFARVATFRAIENRVAIARASNAGISGFISPVGRLYGPVTNSAGQVRTGLGLPELPLIESLVEFRSENEAAFATDPELRLELDRRIAEIERVREEAGVAGWSAQPLRITERATLFQKTGDWLTPSLITALCLMNGAAFIPRRLGPVQAAHPANRARSLFSSAICGGTSTVPRSTVRSDQYQLRKCDIE